MIDFRLYSILYKTVLEEIIERFLTKTLFNIVFVYLKNIRKF